MKKVEINDILNISSEIVDDGLLLSHNEINSILGNNYFSDQYSVYFQKYMKFLSDMTGISHIDSYYKHLSFGYNDITKKNVLLFSSKSLILSLSNMLNCFNYDDSSVESIKKSIKKLSQVTNVRELRTNFPFLYENIYKKNNMYAVNNNMRILVMRYEHAKGNLIEFNALKNEYTKKGIDIEKEYFFAKSSLDFKTFIDSSVRHFSLLIDNIHEIEKWINDNPVEITLNESDTKKVFLYVLYQHVENIMRNDYFNRKEEVKKSFVIIEKLLVKFNELFPGDDTIIVFERTFISDKNSVDERKSKRLRIDYKSLHSAFLKLKEKYSDLISTVSIDNDNLDDFRENSLDLDISIVDKKVRRLIDEVKSPEISQEDKNKKMLTLEKIKMILVDIKPEKIQKGIGAFHGHYIYFYPNGMVAIDKLEEYGALYIMPFHVFQLVRYRKNLSEVKKEIGSGVSYISHKNKDWLLQAEELISNGNGFSNESDKEDVKRVSSIEFPYTIETMNKLKKLLDEVVVIDNREQKKKKIKSMLDIDLESGLSNCDNDFGLFNKLIDELSILLDSDRELFYELYEYWKKHELGKKIKRNAFVASITKTRARDIDGNYCCELCGEKSIYSSFVDSHHMIPLSEGGVDNIYNTVCLCTGCHRNIHSGYVTFYQLSHLFDVIRKHISSENPEYLEEFEKMISPFSDEEYYDEHKDEIDKKFSIFWNGKFPKYK